MTNIVAEKVHDPIHRVAMAFERDGDRLLVFTWLDPGGHLPEHFHPTLQERWEVLDGTVAFKLDGRWRDLAPADGPVLVARNARHELKNTSGSQARLRTEVDPAGGLQEFLTETARGARAGLYNGRNLPTSLRGALWIAEFAHRFRDETVMASPPPALQRILLPPLAAVARRRR
jgi:mannose-6-phosphate isomerase-like protein (cupin superfamily)